MKIKSSTVKLLWTLACCVVVCLFTACAQREAQARPLASSVQAQALPPLRVVAFVDQTKSMEEARVPRVSPECLAPLLDRVERSGGEVAVGLIRDRSDAPLVRLYVPPPPDAPVAQPLPRNIFAAASVKKRNDAERSRYEAVRRSWGADAAARVNAFRTAIAPLFGLQDAPRTDIHSALLRAEVFLSEPNLFPRPVKSVVVLVTDGIETVNAGEPLALSVAADVLLVNGTGSIGGLEPLHPVRFEALDAALRFAVEGDTNHVRK